MFRRKKKDDAPEAWNPPSWARELMRILGKDAEDPGDLRRAAWEEARPRPSGASPEDFSLARSASPLPDAVEPVGRATGSTYGPRGAPGDIPADPWTLLRERKLRERDERRRKGRFGELGIFR